MPDERTHDTDCGAQSSPRERSGERVPDAGATLASVKLGRWLIGLAQPGSGDEAVPGRGVRPRPDGAHTAGLLASVAGVVEKQELISANSERILANSEEILAKESPDGSE